MSVTGERLQPTLFERGRPGRGGGKIPHPPKDALDRLPADARRVTPPALPEMNEPDVVRHYVNLSQLNYAVDTGFYPLGSCTMKFNPKLNEWAARLPGFANLHPMAPDEVAQGTLQLLWELERSLAEISGMHCGDAPAGGRCPGRADRDPDDPRAPPGDRPGPPRRGARPGFEPRDQPGHGVDGWLQDHHHPIGGGRRGRCRGVPCRARDPGRRR